MAQCVHSEVYNIPKIKIVLFWTPANILYFHNIKNCLHSKKINLLSNKNILHKLLSKHQLLIDKPADPANFVLPYKKFFGVHQPYHLGVWNIDNNLFSDLPSVHVKFLQNRLNRFGGVWQLRLWHEIFIYIKKDLKKRALITVGEKLSSFLSQNFQVSSHTFLFQNNTPGQKLGLKRHLAEITLAHNFFWSSNQTASVHCLENVGHFFMAKEGS